MANYYYFISGLPNITLEDARPAANLKEFLEDVRKYVPASDYRLVGFLFLPDDHRNLLNLLQQRDAPWLPFANFSRETLEAAVAGEATPIPKYMREFIQHYRDGQPLLPNRSWEDQLTTLFYETMENHSNHFLRTWFKTDRTIRNLLTAINNRQHQVPIENALVGQDSIVESLVKSVAGDFGLTNLEPYIDQILRLRDTSDLLEREYAVDQLYWNLAEQINFFESFNIDIVLGYIVRLRLARRWQQLDTETGKAKLKGILDAIDRSFAFGEEFTLERRIRL